MLVRLSLDETCGVGRLRHDVVRGGGVAYIQYALNSLSPWDSWSLDSGTLVLLWTLVCTTLDDMMT